jgi:hypothetical protein
MKVSMMKPLVYTSLAALRIKMLLYDTPIVNPFCIIYIILKHYETKKNSAYAFNGLHNFII